MVFVHKLKAKYKKKYFFIKFIYGSDFYYGDNDVNWMGKGVGQCEISYLCVC